MGSSNFSRFVVMESRQSSLKHAGDERVGSAGDIYVLTDQVTIHPCYEIIGIEIKVFDVRVELRCDVIAQPLRVHAEAEVAQRVDARAARFRHLVARDGDETVNVDV